LYVAALSITTDGLTKGTPVCVAISEVPVPDYRDVCLIRGDQGRAIRALLDRIADKWALLIIATLHPQRLRFHPQATRRQTGPA
jgi:hypothetical protein